DRVSAGTRHLCGVVARLIAHGRGGVGGAAEEYRTMSLYYVQKLLYQLNRDPAVRRRFEEDRDDLLDEYVLTEEERRAIEEGDIGLLYVMGVNGQILMHYSALLGQSWDEYIAAMKDGVKTHGSVREGLYTLLEDREQCASYSPVSAATPPASPAAPTARTRRCATRSTRSSTS